MYTKKSIIEIVSEHGIDLKPIGNLLRGFCPFHDDKSKPNFTVYPETDSYFCFSCGEGGDVIQFIAKIEGVSYKTILDRFESATVDLTELQEKIDGAFIENEPETYNQQANILISRIAKGYIQKYPDKAEQILEFLRKFDLRLLKPIYFTDFEKIITETRQNLEKLV